MDIDGMEGGRKRRRWNVCARHDDAASADPSGRERGARQRKGQRRVGGRRSERLALRRAKGETMSLCSAAPKSDREIM